MNHSATMHRWGVVIAGVVILMCLGVAYSWGVFLIPIDQDMGWGRAKISFAVSLLLLVFSVFMAVGGFLEKKIGPRQTAGLGGALVGLGWLLASLAQTPLILYLCYGVIAGIGTGLSYMPSISSGIRWFPEKKGLVTGIIVCGFGFGTAFLSPLITRLINLYGWRGTMAVCGVVFGLMIAAAAQFLRVPPAANSAQDGTPGDGAAFGPSEMIKTKAFPIMFLTYLISMIAGMMTIGHLVAFITDKNFSAMQAALALTILSIFNGAGRVAFGYASDLWGAKKILILLFSLIGAAMLVLFHAGILPVIYVLSAVIGLCFGGFLAVYPALTAEYFGRRDFALNYGLLFVGYGIGCFLGPLIGGWVHDTTQSYVSAFYFAGALAVAGGVGISFLKRPSLRCADPAAPAVIHASDRQSVQQAAAIIRQGGLVAFPTETVYGLGADAFNARAVAKIFAIKGRPAFNPLIVHIASVDDLDKVVHPVGHLAYRLAEQFWPGPLTMVLPRKTTVPEIVTAGLATVGVRMPDHPVALDLIRAADCPLAAPSANQFGSLSPTTAAHVARHLPGVDYILDAGRTAIGLESTVIDLRGDQFRILRHGVITAEDILRTVPSLRPGEIVDHPLAAPGMLKAHYRPQKPVFILGESLPQDFKKEEAGLLSFSGDGARGYKVVEFLTRNNDAREYAVNLFASLHRLDETDVKFIVAEGVPERGIGLAIMDRLRKAAYQYSQQAIAG